MKTHRHLIREYVNREPIAECGAHIKEKDGVFLACKVTCPKCKKTGAFKKAAQHPFFGVPKPEDSFSSWEAKAFRCKKS